MSRGDSEAEAGIAPPPRAARDLVGHEEAEQTLLAAYRSGRMPHAWLIGGPPGVGKATLAYRLARFVLAHPDPLSPAVQAARSLDVDPEHPTFRRVAAEGHPDLFVLRRTVGDTGKLRSVITVDEVRRAVAFFGLTPGEGGWRVCIVDTADELQFPNAANALLKVIEEPPARSLFLLVSHAPGRLLPTIRSRCRRLVLRALPLRQVVQIAATATGRPEDDAQIAAAAAAAGGSVGRALAWLDGDLLAVRRDVETLLARLPAVDDAALHALGERIAGTDAEPLAVFADTVRDWLSARLSAPGADLDRLARVGEVWDKVARAAQDAETYNLERKPLVFSVFGWLAGATR